MAEEIITVRDADKAPGGGHVEFSDLLRFEEIIVRVVSLWRSVTTLAAGAATNLTTVKVHIGGGEYTWNMGSIKRER